MPKTVLVTGANRGLGLETCRQLGDESFQVLLAARDRGEGVSAAEELAEQGIDAAPYRLDVTEQEDISAIRERLGREGVQLDALVNNAGVGLEGLDAKSARRTLDVNFYGPLRVTDALLPLLSDGSGIVMVSSGMGQLSAFSKELREAFLDSGLDRDGLTDLMDSFVEAVRVGRHRDEGWPDSAYRVSKAGLNALTRILAEDLKDRGISVNSVCPGWVRTDMGGSGAPRSVEEGASSIVWPILQDEPPTGGFFRDGRRISW